MKFQRSLQILMLGVALAVAAPAQPAEDDFQPPPLHEFEVSPREVLRGQKVRGVDISGCGDGAARHFSYLLKVTRGLLTLQLQARAKQGATSMTVRIEDSEGDSVSTVEAVAGAGLETIEVGRYQSEEPQTLRVHVNIDPNCGPYTVTVTGPLER